MTDVGLKVESAMCYVTPFDRPLSGHGSGGMFHNVRQCSRMLPKYGDGRNRWRGFLQHLLTKEQRRPLGLFFSATVGLCVDPCVAMATGLAYPKCATMSCNSSALHRLFFLRKI